FAHRHAEGTRVLPSRRDPALRAAPARGSRRQRLKNPHASSLIPAASGTAEDTLAIFDLDGTLTRHEKLLAYLTGFLRPNPRCIPRAIALILQVLPVLLAFAAGRADGGALKSAAIRAIMAGYGRSEIEQWTQEFVPNTLEHGMHADALTALEAHRRAGDILVLL